MAASWLDCCRFTPTAGGTTDFTFSTAVTGYQSPAAAGVANSVVYTYRAESTDLSQWEVGFGAYNTGTGVLSRTTVLFNSAGTTAKINFTVAPQVAIVALKEDLLSANEANSFNATQKLQARLNIAAVLRGQIAGLTLSAAGATATFGIAAGEAADSTAVDLMVLGSAFTKTTGAWVVGTGNGAMDTGAVAASTGYHVFLIKRPDTGLVDVLFSLSATAPTLPANYTLFRRIGWMKTDGSSQWLAFTQVGDEFHWAANAVDVNTANPGTAAVTAALSVPSGVSVIALFHATLQSGTATGPGLLFSALDENDVAPFSATGSNNADMWCAAGGQFVYGSFARRTNTSAQIRYRVSANSATTTVYVYTYGWIDTRGRLA